MTVQIETIEVTSASRRLQEKWTIEECRPTVTAYHPEVLEMLFLTGVKVATGVQYDNVKALPRKLQAHFHKLERRNKKALKGIFE